MQRHFLAHNLDLPTVSRLEYLSEHRKFARLLHSRQFELSENSLWEVLWTGPKRDYVMMVTMLIKVSDFLSTVFSRHFPRYYSFWINRCRFIA